jgi:hypothetical protein
VTLATISMPLVPYAAVTCHKARTWISWLWSKVMIPVLIQTRIQFIPTGESKNFGTREIRLRGTYGWNRVYYSHQMDATI